MKITGYQLQQAIKARQKTRDLLQGQFSGSLYKFEDEQKRDPISISGDLERLEREIAQVQTAQGVYNTKVVVTFEKKDISLLQAIKQVGGLDRLSSLWTGVAKQSAGTLSTGRRSRYDPYGAHAVRDKEQEYAKETVSSEDAIQAAEKWSKKARNLRACISAGNAREIELNVNPELFED